MWTNATRLTGEDFKRARDSGRFVPEHDRGRMLQTARKSTGERAPRLPMSQTVQKGTSSEAGSSGQSRGRGRRGGRGR